jgi:hypothetical protein
MDADAVGKRNVVPAVLIVFDKDALEIDNDCCLAVRTLCLDRSIRLDFRAEVF